MARANETARRARGIDAAQPRSRTATKPSLYPKPWAQSILTEKNFHNDMESHTSSFSAPAKHGNHIISLT